MNNPSFVLLVVAQLLRALVATTAPQATTAIMPVPADNVTVAGLQSDVSLIEARDPNYINPVNPAGMVVPPSTVSAPTSTRVFIPTPAMYNVFDETKF